MSDKHLNPYEQTVPLFLLLGDRLVDCILEINGHSLRTNVDMGESKTSAQQLSKFPGLR